MKKNALLLLLGVACFASSLHAQVPMNTRDSININKINAMVLVHGDMWWDPQSQVAKCEFPKGSGKNISFASSPWMSGYDGSGQLHVAAQTYRQDGMDYWPGPLDSATGSISLLNSQQWSKIWKVNRTDIQYFQSLTTHTTSNTLPAILTWPAAGNIYATGNLGAALSIPNTAKLAPFVDLNSNGIYEPLAGDYPDVKGDQALWWVFSDNGPTHTQTQAAPLKVEVHAMAYAYNRGTLLDNVVYYEYNIINKSSNTYNYFRISLFSDVDLGYYNDDFIGFDSVHRMGIAYSGVPADGQNVGFPPNSYGPNAPVVGVSMVVLPGDAGTTYAPVGSFDYYNNDFSVIGNPSNGIQFDNYMRGKMRNGDDFTNDFTGRGVPSKGYGSGPVSNYIFTGDPADTTKWSECNSGNYPGDRRFIISSNDFTLSPGQIQRVVMALVTTDTNQGGCPNVGFGPIKTVADTAWHDFYNPPPPLPLAITNVAGNIENFELYPNPAHDKINLVSPSGFAQHIQVQVFNTLGQEMHTTIETNSTTKEINTAYLPGGVYYILLQNGSNRQALRFIKE